MVTNTALQNKKSGSGALPDEFAVGRIRLLEVKQPHSRPAPIWRRS